MLSLIFLAVIAGNLTITELGTTGVEISFSMPEVTREDYSFPEA